jgi:hypothetical protein
MVVLARFPGPSIGRVSTTACCHHPPVVVTISSSLGIAGGACRLEGSHSSDTSFSFNQLASLHMLYTRVCTRSIAYNVLLVSYRAMSTIGASLPLGPCRPSSSNTSMCAEKRVLGARFSSAVVSRNVKGSCERPTTRRFEGRRLVIGRFGVWLDCERLAGGSQSANGLPLSLRRERRLRFLAFVGHSEELYGITGDGLEHCLRLQCVCGHRRCSWRGRRVEAGVCGFSILLVVLSVRRVSARAPDSTLMRHCRDRPDPRQPHRDSNNSMIVHSLSIENN